MYLIFCLYTQKNKKQNKNLHGAKAAAAQMLLLNFKNKIIIIRDSKLEQLGGISSCK